ncbi:MAG: PSD1 domain-containing protein, partial [Akkermansiaceae bacterium]|nr:PSD1 domain-containing protein [Akkermansiaceae bacterium]
MILPPSVRVLAFGACLLSPSVVLRAAPEKLDFARDVQPLLAEHCAECHGGVKKKGGLSLVTRAHAFAETDSGAPAIVPGDPGKSELIARLLADDEDDRMPPKEALAPEAIDRLKRWVAEGAEWPEHWSLMPVENAAPPSVKNAAWTRNEIDRFVLARLEAEGVAPSPEADAGTLLRRLSLDLTGLLPEPEKAEAFAAAWAKADAKERDRLYTEAVEEGLASPHFGERWARHWLDEARYADSSGYEKDSTRSDAFRYRDWVIGAINDDMPFDQFTIRQIAGDLLPDATTDDRVATQFHLMCQFNLEGGVDAEEDRTKRVIDRLTTVGAVWLGASLECTQCHNHPYDPLTQREFYHLYAFFNNADDLSVIYAGDPPKDAAEKLKKRADDFAPVARLIEDQVTNKNLATKLQGDLTKLRNSDNAGGFTRVISERTENRRKTYFFNRGNFLQPDIEGGDVAPAVPAVWPVLKNGGDSAPPSRLDFARWLANPEHPLTARVTVNKIWMRLFGAPLVASVRDFGMKGQQPTHPEMLDWLARRFGHEAKWSRKEMIRLIVNSAAYRQSSATRSELADRDAGNQWLARQNRFRVEAEIVRDVALQASGLLCRKTGGPSVFPPVPADVAALSYANNFKWNTSKGDDRYRRGLYTFFKRTAPDPNLVAFDCPDASMTTPARGASNTPIQALTTLQNEVFHEAAQAFALRLLAEEAANDDARLARAFVIALGRTPEADETAALKELLADSRAYYEKTPEAAAELAGEHRREEVSPAENAAWIATG